MSNRMMVRPSARYGARPADRRRDERTGLRRRGNRCASPTPAVVYRRRRLAAGVLVALAVFAIGATSVLVAGPGGAPAAAAGAAPPAPAVRAVHVAHRGDTLWAIAHEHRGEVAHDAYLEALIRLNGGTRIEVGQAVQLP